MPSRKIKAIGELLKGILLAFGRFLLSGPGILMALILVVGIGQLLEEDQPQDFSSAYDGSYAKQRAEQWLEIERRRAERERVRPARELERTKTLIEMSEEAIEGARFKIGDMMTDCDELEAEINADYECKFSDDCLMTRDELVQSKERQEDWKLYCEDD